VKQQAARVPAVVAENNFKTQKNHRKGNSIMKIAISSTGKDLNSQVDPHFGRCTFFIIVETDDMSFEAFDNENMALGGGAGIQAAGFLSSKGVSAVLTGNCGPNAMKTFSAAGVQVFTGMTGTVAEAIAKYKTGDLSPSTEATVEEKAGLKRGKGTQSTMPPSGVGRCAGGTGRGQGGGRGVGGGGGRGMGGRCMGGTGRGMGMGRSVAGQGAGNASNPVYEKEENLTLLKEQATELQRQVDKIREKIKNMQQ
jgi:predicted Fe-Mo cluster-binding NifX family protein